MRGHDDMGIPNKLRQEDGAAAVEFALIVGVLAMLLFGMLQFGLAFFELQNLRAAAREGARAGAVGADESEVRAAVEDASLGSIDAGNSAIAVQYSYDTSVTTPGWATGTCPAVSDPNVTENTGVRVRIDLNDAGLPARLQDIFTVNVPLIPPISLTSAEINGQFRCEGV
jgi:Flp pilus assembly protein TadG